MLFWYICTQGQWKIRLTVMPRPGFCGHIDYSNRSMAGKHMSFSMFFQTKSGVAGHGDDTISREDQVFKTISRIKGYWVIFSPGSICTITFAIQLNITTQVHLRLNDGTSLWIWTQLGVWNHRLGVKIDGTSTPSRIAWSEGRSQNLGCSFWTGLVVECFDSWFRDYGLERFTWLSSVRSWICTNAFTVDVQPPTWLCTNQFPTIPAMSIQKGWTWTACSIRISVWFPWIGFARTISTCRLAGSGGTHTFGHTKSRIAWTRSGSADPRLWSTSILAMLPWVQIGGAGTTLTIPVSWGWSKKAFLCLVRLVRLVATQIAGSYHGHMGRQQQGTIERHLQVTCAPSKLGPKKTAANEYGKKINMKTSYHQAIWSVINQWAICCVCCMCLPGQRCQGPQLAGRQLLNSFRQSSSPTRQGLPSLAS